MSEPPPPMRFEPLVTCSNPMETEIYPSALREAEIPHRTEWQADGRLRILVADEWLDEARQALDRASRIFFGQQRSPTEPEEAVPPGGDERAGGDEEPAAGGDRPADEEDEDGSAETEVGGLFSDAMPTPEETRLRKVWPAWLLAAVPGLGLGHLYAGKMQMFVYLLFCSLLGLLFHEFTGSWWSFLLVGFSWAVDLGFAAVHVKEHNRRALRARKRLEEAEQGFLQSL